MANGTPNDLIHPVVLSGGYGTRLWPISRALYPKQLQPLFTDRTLLQETALRVRDDGFADPIVVCNHEHRFIAAEQLRAQGIEPQAIILEPVGRNTAPAAAVAAMLLLRSDPDAFMLLLPSDQVIQDTRSFHTALERGLTAAKQGSLVTFGIEPTGPETGYGYIRRGPQSASGDGCYDVAQFTEKPDVKTAETFIASGEYYWNGGIFLMGARSFLDELEARQPETIALCQTAIEKGQEDLEFLRLDETSFAEIKGNSIDYAVMEHTDHAAVVPVDMGWSDVGSWSALWDISDKDDQGNVLSGDVVSKGLKNSYIRSDGRLVAALGLEDVIIVATDDAILAASKDMAQSVKDIVTLLETEGRTEHHAHTQVYRPWGWYQSLSTGERFQVKLITVNPGQRLSLQLHHRRAEHWVVVSGEATIIRGDELFVLGENESTFIPVQTKHRLENNTADPLMIIEVQSGDYLGEDDIVRFDDIYGRVL